MRLETPTRIRDLQRGLYLKAKREYALVCHEVKMIGKPSAGKLHAGFDEGGTGRLFMGDSKRARSWKRWIQPRVGLKAVEPVLYSTLILTGDLTLVRAVFVSVVIGTQFVEDFRTVRKTFETLSK